jgi:hypothetical protein
MRKKKGTGVDDSASIDRRTIETAVGHAEGRVMAVLGNALLLLIGFGVLANVATFYAKLLRKAFGPAKAVKVTLENEVSRWRQRINQRRD